MTIHPKDQATEALRTHFEALASDPSFKLSRSRRGTYVNPAVARDWKWFQLGASRAQQPAPAASEWDERGQLAASLTCWHRLTGNEADELVSLFQGMRELAADKTLTYESVLAELVDKITGADSGDILADALAASKALDERAAPAAGAVAGPSVTVGPVGLEWLIAEINKLPTVRASEIDGEESDGTPQHWRNRPHVSLRKLERLLREFFTPPPADAAPTPAAQADSVLEDAARLEFEMQHGSALDAARKQGGAI